MALVHESIGDFVLFPRDQAYCEPLPTVFDEGFVGLDFEHGSTLAMQQPYTNLGMGHFDNSSSMPAFSSGQSHYYNAPDLVLERPKGLTRPYQQRQTPSGSASPPMPQSMEHPPSSLSSASGASGQSTASSMAGSPYSLATHSLSSQDVWSEPNQGLGIAHDMIHNDAFPQEAFPTGGLENELCFQDGKFSDSFVGECGRLSSLSSFQTFSSNSRDSPIPRPVSPFSYTASMQRATTSAVAPNDSSAGPRHPRQVTVDGDDHDGLESRSFTSDARTPGKRLFKQPQKPASATLPALDQPTHFQWPAAMHGQTHSYQSPKIVPSESNGGFVAPLASSCRFSSPLFLVHFHCTLPITPYCSPHRLFLPRIKKLTCVFFRSFIDSTI